MKILPCVSIATAVFQDLICWIISKYFLEKIKPEGLAKMAAALGDNSAYSQTIFAFAYDEKQPPLLFVGQTQGRIVEPRGSRNFGWDCCFEAEDTGKTYGEMSSEEKNQISHRYRAMAKFIDYIRKVAKKL